MSGAIRVLLALVLAASAHATCSADEPADNEALNHFVAATNGCSLANETSETCPAARPPSAFSPLYSRYQVPGYLSS